MNLAICEENSSAASVKLALAVLFSASWMLCCPDAANGQSSPTIQQVAAPSPPLMRKNAP